MVAYNEACLDPGHMEALPLHNKWTVSRTSGWLIPRAMHQVLPQKAAYIILVMLWTVSSLQPPRDSTTSGMKTTPMGGQDHLTIATLQKICCYFDYLVVT